MGFQLAEAFVDIKGNDNPLIASFAKAKAETGAFIGQTKAMWGGLNSILAFGGLAGIGFTFAGAIKSAAEAERTTLKLKAALQANGMEVDKNIEKITGLGGALSRALKISGKGVKEVAVDLVNLGVGEDQLVETTKAAYGLAYIMGGDAQSAAHLLTKAMSGNWMMLERQLPLLKQFHTQEEKMAFLTNFASKGLKEQTEAQKGAMGSMDGMERAMGKLQATAGGAFAPAITKAAIAVTEFFRTFTKGDVQFEMFSTGMARAMKSADADFFHMGAVAQDFWDKLTGNKDKSESNRLHKEAKNAGDQVNYLDQQLEKLRQREKAEQKADDELTVGKLGNLGKIEKKNKDVFSKIEDVWKNAQKAAAETGEAMGEEGLGQGQGKAAAAASITKKDRGATVTQNRAWHAQNAKQLSDYLNSFFGMQGNLQNEMTATTAPKSFVDSIQRKMGDLKTSQDIAEFGSTGKAELERKKEALTEGMRRKHARDRAEIAARGESELGMLSSDPALDPLRDRTKARTAAAIAKYHDTVEVPDNEKLKSEKARLDKGYAPAIKKEEADIATPINATMTAMKHFLQKSLIGQADGKPVLVKTAAEDKLISLIEKLTLALPNMGGFQE